MTDANKIKPVSIAVGFLFLLCILFLGLIADFNGSTNEKLHKVVQNVRSQRHLSDIDSERRASIKKIVDIISRYNRVMDAKAVNEIAEEVYLMSQKYPNLNIDFICATITHESARTWDPKITSPVGAMGLMQVMPSTGAFLALEEGIEWTSDRILYEPKINIRLGCRYLSQLVTMYEKDGGLAAYNGGPNRAEMWIASSRNNSVLFEETRGYVPAVLKLYNEFRSQDLL